MKKSLFTVLKVLGCVVCLVILATVCLFLYINKNNQIVLCPVKGTLTVEASLVIPIFMFAIFMLLSLFNLLIFQTEIRSALFQEGRKLSQCGYSESIRAVNIRDEILDLIDDQIKTKAPVDGGMEGLDFSGCDFTDDEIIRLSVKYVGKLPYDFTGLFKYSFEQKCIMHIFNGYEHGLNSNSNSTYTEEYVYVTEFGTVYHRNIECSHIKLNIIKTDGKAVGKLRNKSGGKYKRCEHCKARKKDGVLYVTPDGDRFHNTINCSGLKRTIKSIPLSQAVKKYAPCSGCGGK